MSIAESRLDNVYNLDESNEEVCNVEFTPQLVYQEVCDGGAASPEVTIFIAEQSDTGSLYELLLEDCVKDLVESGFEMSAARIAFGRCTLCGQKVDINEFVDEIGRREYGISGMCQSCQDDVFGKDDEEWY